jgi:hypothetical protein
MYLYCVGGDSAVGTATRYGADWRSSPAVGEVFALVQTGPRAHKALCAIGTGWSDREMALTTHPI